MIFFVFYGFSGNMVPLCCVSSSPLSITTVRHITPSFCTVILIPLNCSYFFFCIIKQYSSIAVCDVCNTILCTRWHVLGSVCHCHTVTVPIFNGKCIILACHLVAPYVGNRNKVFFLAKSKTYYADCVVFMAK